MYILSKLNLQWIFVVENTFTEDEGASTKKKTTTTILEVTTMRQ